jgi:Na+-transporting NADH:ubiquinone oxidoreductase subunit C
VSAKRDSISNILLVAVGVCLVASIVVSGAAVALKPVQQINRELDQKQNILIAAGVLEEGETTGPDGRGIQELFEEFEVRVVDLRTGEYTDAVDPSSYDQLRAARDPDFSRALSESEDTPTLGRLEQYGLVYLRRGESGDVDTAVLPVRGYGLWGTMYGYLALQGDFETVQGLGFYQQQETPGLGGEVTNPRWKAQWEGVELYGPQGSPAVELVKSRAPAGSDAADHQVDALAGATLTSRGVENLVNFWVGELGYGEYLKRMKRGNA